MVETHRIQVHTVGNSDVVDLGAELSGALGAGRIRNGIATLFVVGSTAAISTTEYEPGLVGHDLAHAMEGIAPEHGRYVHEETWHDDNGHSHVRATLVGPSLTVPLVGGRLTLGRWQQVVLMDFDTQAREREVVVQVIGEP